MLNPFVTGISIVVTVNIMSLQSHGHDTVYRYGMWLVSKMDCLQCRVLGLQCDILSLQHDVLTWLIR